MRCAAIGFSDSDPHSAHPPHSLAYDAIVMPLMMITTSEAAAGLRLRRCRTTQQQLRVKLLCTSKVGCIKRAVGNVES
jgi:hypothetical protein